MSNHIATSHSVLHDLVQSSIEALEEGMELLTMLEPADYRCAFKPAFQSHIGAHFRHLLEHYQCFFKQLPSGSISYDKRKRDQQLELEINYAHEVLTEICDLLRGTDFAALSDNESGAGCTEQLTVEDQPLSGPLPTTIERELLFLLSHTVHHYAMIAAMARALGKVPEKGFGVAIATKTFQACDVQSLSSAS